jgi:hypothetical protein
MEDLLRSPNYLIVSQTTATDKHEQANVAVFLVELAGLIAHWQLTIRTDRRSESRLLLKGLDHDTSPLVPNLTVPLCWCRTPLNFAHILGMRVLFQQPYSSGRATNYYLCLVQRASSMD